MRTTLIFSAVLALSTIMFAQTHIPVGTVIPVVFNSSLDANNSKPGQEVTAKVAQTVPLQNGSKIKAGTRVLGEVVSVSPEENSQPATMVLRFDGIEIAGQKTPITTHLRALASPLEVSSAQVATSGDDRGSEPLWDQTTVQIGGDVVYGEDGPVARGLETVGTPDYPGVLSQIAANPEGGCRGPIDGNNSPQALWVFSHDACGVYGYPAVIKRTGQVYSDGGIILSSTHGDLKIRSGSGMLLRVVGVTDTRNDSATKSNAE